MAVPHWLERTELLVGEECLDKLSSSNVLLVGLGGVGSYVGEFLVRAGIGSLTIIDGDVVDVTNKNRQLPALNSTIGRNKTEVLAQRFMDINESLNLKIISHFMEPEDMEELMKKEQFDFVCDCIDSIQPKVSLIKSSRKAGCKIISSMGAGGKLDPAKVNVTDISKTMECKFAKMVRKYLKKDNIYRGVDRCLLR